MFRLFDWSRPFAGWPNSRQPARGLKREWHKPFLLDLAENDPDLAIKMVFADRDLLDEPVNGTNGKGLGPRRNR
jgi:hypothetical protein